MPKFALKKIRAVKGKINFYDLCIDGEKQFKSFCDSLEEIHNSEKTQLYARLDYIAQLKSLPKTKFRDLTPKKEDVKEFEIKTKNLRVYLIKIKQTGNVVVLGGHKNTQKKDIPKFRSLKKQYLDSLTKK